MGGLRTNQNCSERLINSLHSRLLKMNINLKALCQLSVEQWESLCRYLQPGGHKEGSYWLAGSINGEAGRSFNVNLRTGIFGDWATDNKMRRGPVMYWMAVRGVDFHTAVREFVAWRSGQAGIPLTGYCGSEIKKRKKKVLFPTGLGQPSEKDCGILWQSRAIGIEATRIAARRGLLYSFDDKLNGRCWLYTDQRRRCGLRRRLDNKPFRLSNGSQPKVACCPGSDMRRPIGYQEAESFPYLGIVEGAPNALSLLAHACASGVETHVAPICMPCAGANFTESSLAYLQNKRARIFIDDDKAGQEAAERWAIQLQQANIVVDGFSCAGLLRTNGRPVKDLNDVLEVDYESWERFCEEIENIMDFVL